MKTSLQVHAKNCNHHRVDGMLLSSIIKLLSSPPQYKFRILLKTAIAVMYDTIRIHTLTRAPVQAN